MTTGSIVYVIGDAARPELAPNRVDQLADGRSADMIVHVVNSVGAWGKGFTAALDATYGPEQRVLYQRAHRVYQATNNILGQVLVTKALALNPDLNVAPTYVAHLFAQRGLRTWSNQRPFDLASLVKCVDALTDPMVDWLGATGARVHMPRIGTGLGGGKWSEIEPVIARLAEQVPTYVYDLP